MPPPLADRLGFDTISWFERAARDRFVEAELLAGYRNDLGAIYLYGYAIEMIIKAAYFKAFGHAKNQEIKRSDRKLAADDAKTRGIMISTPHDFEAWAQYLVEFNKTLPRPTYDPSFGIQLIDQARLAYQHWRPDMRYRVTSVLPGEVECVRSSTCWFLRNYSRL